MFNIITKKAASSLSEQNKLRIVDAVAEKILIRMENTKAGHFAILSNFENVIARAKDSAVAIVAEEVARIIIEQKKDDLIQEVYKDNVINDVIRENLRRKLDANLEVY